MLLLVLACLSVAVLGLLLNKVVSNRLALIKFRKVSRDLPICPGARLLGNHTRSIMIGENNCEKLRTWHEQLGHTVGWLKGTEFCVSTIDLDLIKTIIKDEPSAHLNRTKYNMPSYEFEKSIMQAPEDKWRPIRRIIAPALTSNKFKMPNVQQEIEHTISEVVKHIDHQIEANQQVDADDIAQKFTLDVIFKCFYKQRGLVDFGDPNDHWTRSYDKALHHTQSSAVFKIAIIFPIFRRLVDWLIWHFHPQGADRSKLVDFVRLQTELGLRARRHLDSLTREARMATDKIDFLLADGTRFRRNILDSIIDHFIDGKITGEQLTNNSVFLLTAAHKTVADPIAHIIYLLSIHQDVQQKLRSSIAADGIESDYLDWVIKESLRILPPAPLGCSRTISRDIEVENRGKGRHIVPKGTYVLTCSYVIHRLKKYWGEDADQFRPERWRDTSHHHPFQFIPFGAGLRICPGRMLAMHEMKMLFSTLLLRYKFEGELREDAYNFNAPFFIFLLPKSTTKVTVKPLKELDIKDDMARPER